MLPLVRRLEKARPEQLEELHHRIETGVAELDQCITDFGVTAGLVKFASLYGSDVLKAESLPGLSRELRAGVERLVDVLDAVLPAETRHDSNPWVDARVQNFVVSSCTRAYATLPRRERARYLEGLTEAFSVPRRLQAVRDTALFVRARWPDAVASLPHTAVIAHQHILGSVVAQLAEFAHLGCDPRQIYVLGKPYSTSDLAVIAAELEGLRIIDDGWRAFRSPSYENVTNDQAEYYRRLEEHVWRIIEELPRTVDRVLILDDGGLVIDVVSRLIGGDVPDGARSLDRRVRDLSFVAVEQTTSGKRLIEGTAGLPSQPLRLPTVDVARSTLKIEVEAEYIGDSVVTETNNLLRIAGRDLGRTSMEGATVGVIGIGTVGAWIAAHLLRPGAVRQRQVAQLIGFEQIPERRTVARALGLNCPYRDLPDFTERCDIIIGSTGSAFLGITPDLVRKDTVFVSASSWNYEYWELLRAAARKPLIRIRHRDLGRKFQELHNIRVATSQNGAKAFLLNSGYPINFTGVVDPIPPAKMALTRCLMFGAGIQALAHTHNHTATDQRRFTQLDADLETEIAELCA